MKTIDISEKKVVRRTAKAKGTILLGKKSLILISEKEIEKGDPLEVAELKAIEAVKGTPSAIAFCHPIPIEFVSAEARLIDGGVEISVTVSSLAKTGVEMEALYGVSVGLLNIWDMVKKYEKDENGQYPYTKITDIEVIKKEKGS
ncbi:MAG: cyclic pyranopterin monophosphate synthase MoaC [Nitrososphaeria archaeon]